MSDEWDDFERSGRVADYLAYCERAGKNAATNSTYDNGMGYAIPTHWPDDKPMEQKKENTHETGSYSDGNDTSGISHERVR